MVVLLVILLIKFIIKGSLPGSGLILILLLYQQACRQHLAAKVALVEFIVPFRHCPIIIYACFILQLKKHRPAFIRLICLHIVFRQAERGGIVLSPYLYRDNETGYNSACQMSIR